MTKSEKQLWKPERAQGYGRFLLRHGLLRAGLPFGILMVGGKILYSLFTHHPVAPIWRLLAEFGFCFLGFGALMGKWTWQHKERDYNKPTEDYDGV